MLARLPVGQTGRMLARLTTASLIQQTAADRFRFHDLLRLYSRERCEIEESPAEVKLARTSLFAYYVRQLDAVADVLFPTWTRLPRTELETNLATEVFENSAAAAAWMDQEGPNVIAATVEAAERGPAATSWHLAESLRAYLVARGRYRAEGVVACEAALKAAVVAGDLRAAGAMHSVRAAIYFRTQDLAKTLEHVFAELDAYDRSGFHEGRARGLINLAGVYEVLGRLKDATERAEDGLRLAEEHGFDHVRLYGLINLSIIEEQRGRLDRAERYAHAALELSSVSPSSASEGASREGLAHILVQQGRLDEAVDQYTRALACYRESGTRHYEAEALRGLAEANRRVGDSELALSQACEALALAEESGVDQDQLASLVTVAAVHHDLGNAELSASCVDKALEMSRGLAYGRGEISALLALAAHHRVRGELTAAREHASRAGALSATAELADYEGKSELVLAWLALDAEDLAVAREHGGRALGIHRASGSVLGEAQALHVLGLAMHTDNATDEKLHYPLSLAWLAERLAR